MVDVSFAVDPSQPALIRSTEPGTFFRKPLATVLRALALLGSLSIVPPLIARRELGAPAAIVILAGCTIAAWFAGRVLFVRARRLEATPDARFPVVPALRETTRAVAEACFVWCMSLASAGLTAFAWAVPEIDARIALTAVVAAIATASLGWLALLAAHMGTEVFSALVQIANNTHRWRRPDAK